MRAASPMIIANKVIESFGLVATGVARAARAQPRGKISRSSFVTARGRTDSIDPDFIGAFPRGMRELGYVEGKNLVIEWRFEPKLDALTRVAAELLRLNWT